MARLLPLALLTPLILAVGCKKTADGQYEVKVPKIETTTETLRTPRVEVQKETTTVVTPKLKVKKPPSR